MVFRGYLDAVRQSHIEGWAGDDSGPVPVTILINGRKVAIIEPNVSRPDLAVFGYPIMSGFLANFEEPLGIDETVSALFPDGSHLTNSPSTEHSVRLREVLDGINVNGIGLELGPLDKPLISKKRFNVFYVDHATRDALLEKYRGTPETSIAYEQIPETDIVWSGGSLAEVCPPGVKYDYCLSSHAIEHVPDMVGWIRGISDVLKVGGLLNMAIPDRDQTFDHLRRVTSTSEFVADFIEKRTRPSARQLFDAVAYMSWIDGEDRQDLAHGLSLAQHIEETEDYLDVHCQVFTLTSFLTVFGDLAEMGLVNLRLRKAYPCRAGNNEFVVSLEKTASTPVEIAETYRKAIPAPPS